MSTAPTASPRRAASRSIWGAGVVTALVAAALTSLVWLVGQLTPATWQVVQGEQTREVLVVMPALASVASVAVGTLALWVLARVPRGVTVWTVLAVLFGVGSVTAPLSGAEDAWTGGLLALMHLVVLGCALVLLRPAARQS